MPGYDDTGTDRVDAFAVDRKNGNYYRETWSAAVASQPDWVLITSFNEWVEGTMIEVSTSYGDLYLNLTRDLAAANVRWPWAKSRRRCVSDLVLAPSSSVLEPSGQATRRRWWAEMLIARGGRLSTPQQVIAWAGSILIL